MDPTTLIALVAGTGAAAFFVSGYATRAARPGGARPESPPDDAELVQARQALAAQRSQLAEAANTSATLSQTAAELAHVRAEHGEAEQRWTRAVEQARHHAAQAQAALEGARREAGEALEAERGSRARAEQRLAEVEGRTAALDERLREAAASRSQAERRLAEAEERRAHAEDEARTARAHLQRAQADAEAHRARAGLGEDGTRQVAALRERVAELESEATRLREGAEEAATAAEELEVLRSSQRDFMLRLRLQQQKVEELEHHAQENAELRQRLFDHAELEAERDRLQTEVRALTARAFAGTPAVAVPVAAPLPADAALGGLLDQVLANAVQRGLAHAAVVADHHGLMLASAGERGHQEPLAVVSGLVAQVGQDAGAELPLGELRSAELLGVDGVGISCHFFRPPGQEALAVTVLRRAGRPADPALARVSSAVERVLAEPQKEGGGVP